MKKNNLITQTAIMTAVNLFMRSVGVWFNAYLTKRIGSTGIGLFQLVMTVYSLAVTFSCAGIRLATTRISVEIRTLKKNDMKKSLSLYTTYGGITGAVTGFILFAFSNLIGNYAINNASTVLPIKILSLSLPFVAMSSCMGGYFTAADYVSQYSVIQILEQLFKIGVTIAIIGKIGGINAEYACISVVVGMTASEIFSFILSLTLKKYKITCDKNKNAVGIKEFMRIAVPDGIGACVRSVLLTVEHLLIPKGFRKSGTNFESALASYGIIHGMAMPILLYPSAVLASLSSLLIPNLATYNKLGSGDKINYTVKRNLKRTLAYSALCSLFFFSFASPLSEIIYKSKEAAKYIKILSPLIPVMYTDMVTDGMLKGLDQQVYSMRYNIIDSAMCVGLVYYLLPKFSVNGYLFILYISEIINFILSIGRLNKICDIGLRCFQEHEEGNSRFFQRKICSGAPSVYEYQTYQVRAKRSQDR